MLVVIKWFDLNRVCKLAKEERRNGGLCRVCCSVRYSEYDEKPLCEPGVCPVLEEN